MDWKIKGVQKQIVQSHWPELHHRINGQSDGFTTLKFRFFEKMRLSESYRFDDWVFNMRDRQIQGTHLIFEMSRQIVVSAPLFPT